MVVVETARGVTITILFLSVILGSLGSKNQTPFYLNHRNHVNTILRFYEALLSGEVFGEDAEMCTRGRARSPETSAAPNGLGQYLTDITDAGYNRSPVTDHKKTLGSVKSMAAAEVWGAALPLAPTWVLASVAASPLPLLLLWGWPLAWRSPSE